MNLAQPARLAVTQAFIAVVVLVAMLIAQEAAGRVAAVRQRQAERRERDRLQALARLAQLLSAAITPAQIGDAVVRQVLNDAGAQALNLGLLRADGRALEWVTMAGYPQRVVDEFGSGVPLSADTAATEAVRSGRPVVIHGPDEYRRRCPANAHWLEVGGGKSLVSWPLSAGGESIGVLVLMWTEPQPPNTAQLAYASAVATMVTQALVRARVYADEHARAAVLQAAVLPSNPEPIPGIDVGVNYEPADVAQGWAATGTTSWSCAGSWSTWRWETLSDMAFRPWRTWPSCAARAARWRCRASRPPSCSPNSTRSPGAPATASSPP